MRVEAGRIGEALALIDRSADAAARWREALPTVDLALRSTRAYALWSAGRLTEDLTYSEHELATAIAAGELEPTAMFAFCRGGALIDMGRVKSATGSLRDGLVVFQELAMPMYVSWTLALLARALALGGDGAGAREALHQAEQARPAQVHLVDAELGLAQVWVAVAEGDTSGARRAALELGARHAVSGKPIETARALHDVARLGEPRAVASRLLELATVTDAPVVALYAEHAGGLVSADGARLQAAGDGFDALGCRLLAAEAYAGAAAAFASEGRAASARTAGARASALLAGCEGARTPALTATTVGVTLTRRERDVALLAAAGTTNRDIAERLVLSVRTVESHLAQTYRKLGVRDRRELAAALTPDTGGPAASPPR